MASHSNPESSVHDFTVKDARGNDVDLSKYKGKVLIIVNVASKCGLTNSNYTELSQLYKEYRDKGLEILAFPCNQFNGQEPGSNEEILEFACTALRQNIPYLTRGGIEKPLQRFFSSINHRQVDVNGSNAAPLYKFLKKKQGWIVGDSIKWNFSKFLVDQDGKVVDRYAPVTSPMSIEKDVKKLLGIS